MDKCVCILCGEESNNLLCDDCKEALLSYKQIYVASKKFKETTDLDDQVFAVMYEQCRIKELLDTIQSEDEIDSLIKELMDLLRHTDAKVWLNQQPGRADNFAKYLNNRLRKDFRSK